MNTTPEIREKILNKLSEKLSFLSRIFLKNRDATTARAMWYLDGLYDSGITTKEEHLALRELSVEIWLNTPHRKHSFAKKTVYKMLEKIVKRESK